MKKLLNNLQSLTAKVAEKVSDANKTRKSAISVTECTKSINASKGLLAKVETLATAAAKAQKKVAKNAKSSAEEKSEAKATYTELKVLTERYTKVLNAAIAAVVDKKDSINAAKSEAKESEKKARTAAKESNKNVAINVTETTRLTTLTAYIKHLYLHAANGTTPDEKLLGDIAATCGDVFAAICKAIDFAPNFESKVNKQVKVIVSKLTAAYPLKDINGICVKSKSVYTLKDGETNKAVKYVTFDTANAQDIVKDVIRRNIAGLMNVAPTAKIYCPEVDEEGNIIARNIYAIIATETNKYNSYKVILKVALLAPDSADYIYKLSLEKKADSAERTAAVRRTKANESTFTTSAISFAE